MTGFAQRAGAGWFRILPVQAMTLEMTLAARFSRVRLVEGSQVSSSQTAPINTDAGTPPDSRASSPDGANTRHRHRAPRLGVGAQDSILTVLNVLLKKAAEWAVIERLSCSIKLMPIVKPAASFHDFADYERLVEAAQRKGWRVHLIVLLAGDAGLRSDEIVALE